jgi:hypothetical protein
MLTSRILGAITFKPPIYSEVAKDKTFTGTAWGIVLASVLAGSLYGLYFFVAYYMGTSDGGRNLVGLIAGSIIPILVFLYFVGLETVLAKAIFKSTASFGSMVRSLGLAQTWSVVTSLLLLTALVPALSILSTLALLFGFGATIVSHFIAARAALQLTSGKTLVIMAIVSVPILCYFMFSIIALASI